MALRQMEENWELSYISPGKRQIILALENIRKISKDYLKVKYTIEVIDLLKSPQLAETDEIFAIPTLVRKFQNLSEKLSVTCQTRKKY